MGIWAIPQKQVIWDMTNLSYFPKLWVKSKNRAIFIKTDYTILIKNPILADFHEIISHWALQFFSYKSIGIQTHFNKPEIMWHTWKSKSGRKCADMLISKWQKVLILRIVQIFGGLCYEDTSLLKNVLRKLFYSPKWDEMKHNSQNLLVTIFPFLGENTDVRHFISTSLMSFYSNFS